jgi:hypothetical protein
MARANEAGDKNAKVQVEGFDGPERNARMAEAVLMARYRHATTASAFASASFTGDAPPIASSADYIAECAEKAKDGDLGGQIELLTAQALTLDSIFTELTTRAFRNESQFPDAANLFMRLALKAQSNSRATIEALAKLTRGGEQIIKHVHVDNRGGQAVFTETVQTGGGVNGNDGGQPCGHDIAATCGPALSRPDPQGNGVPVPGDAEWAMPDTRRPVSRRAEGQPQRMEARRPIRGDDADTRPDPHHHAGRAQDGKR